MVDEGGELIANRNQRQRLHILVMAAGTGGHVYPALGFAHCAKALGHSISWMGTCGGLESRLVPEQGFDLNFIDVQGVRGKGLKTLFKAPFVIATALWQSLKLIRRIQPDLVIGFGGYVAGPGGLACRMLRRPLAIHEQNAIAGTTNRLLAGFAGATLCAFKGALPNATEVGNPVRPEILKIDEPEQRIGTRVGVPKLLVVGGSLGASFLNESIPQILVDIPHQERPEIWHQAGPRQLELARECYDRVGVHARVDAYIDDMSTAYEWADLVVCRAGAMTVSELAAAGVASVLVPFPYAIDNHQSLNASHLEEAGAALVYEQAENDLTALGGKVQELLMDRNRLVSMAKAARSRAIPDAASRIVEACEELAYAA